MKTLMVVSGGDAPSINTALAHYTRLAASHGDQAVGATGGFAGALRGHVTPLTPMALAPWMGRGGSYLPSSREPILAVEGARTRLAALLAAHQIDNIVLFGGDGTLRHVLPLLASWGIPVIGLPTTIDNNVPGTERTLGFDSACNYAYAAIDAIHATAHALPGRIFMVETLGGDTGFIALAVAHGASAHAVLLPEFEYDDAWLSARLRDAVAREDYALLVLSEGARGARTLADDIPRWTGIRVRDTRLGHAQRGAAPSHIDRALAADMARVAHGALSDGAMAGVVVVRGSRVQLHEGALDSSPAPIPDRALYNFINGLEPQEQKGS